MTTNIGCTICRCKFCRSWLLGLDKQRVDEKSKVKLEEIIQILFDKRRYHKSYWTYEDQYNFDIYERNYINLGGNMLYFRKEKRGSSRCVIL